MPCSLWMHLIIFEVNELLIIEFPKSDFSRPSNIAADDTFTDEVHHIHDLACSHNDPCLLIQSFINELMEID